jgi:hypothetical protein
VKVTRSAPVLLLLLGCISAAQTSSSAPNEKAPVRQGTVLEVTAVDFDIAWQQQYLYLKVQSDGTVESQILKRKSGDMRFEKADVVALKRTLSTAELRQLKTVLAQGDTLRLKNTYKQGMAVIVDAGTWWDIRIPRQNQIQQIHVVAFAPYAAKAIKHPYPQALLTLGCTVEKLRGDTIGENLDTEDECPKVFPVP